MAYDPFTRGAAPVGVRSASLADAPGRSPLALEVWYPAAPSHAGADLDPERGDRFEDFPGAAPRTQQALRDAAVAQGGAFPVVVFSHGATSHRRSTTQLTTHLASHGYVVLSLDHPGSTLADLMHDVSQAGGDPRLDMALSQQQRPAEVSFAVDRLLDGAVPELDGRLDADRLGCCGVSFGGWTTLAVNSRDARFKASLPIVPAFGKGPLATELLEAALRLDDWGREVPTVILAAEDDALIPLPELRRLHHELPAPKQLVVLRNAGHVHFVDGAAERHELLRTQFTSGLMPETGGVDFVAVGRSIRPMAELCPEAHGADTLRALGLAHMDAHLRGNDAAHEFLARDLAASFARRGIDIELG